MGFVLFSLGTQGTPAIYPHLTDFYWETKFSL